MFFLNFFQKMLGKFFAHVSQTQQRDFDYMTHETAPRIDYGWQQQTGCYVRNPNPELPGGTLRRIWGVPQA
jgi:hypothetical protein